MDIDLSSTWVRWLGIVCLARGVLSLVLNEFTLRVQRVKPWWRDDLDAVRDGRMKEYLRLWIFAVSIAYVEIGCYLSQASAPPIELRLILYVLVGALLIRRRRAFWFNGRRTGGKTE